MSDVRTKNDFDYDPEVRELTRSELDEIYEKNPEKAEETARKIWKQAEQFLSRYGIPPASDVSVRLNPKEEEFEGDIKGAGSTYNQQSDDFNLVTKVRFPRKDAVMPRGEESILFETAVHEGVHSYIGENYLEFNQDLESLLEEVDEKEYSDGVEINNNRWLDYKWALLHRQKPERLENIISLVESEHSKWIERQQEISSKLSETEFGKKFGLNSERDRQSQGEKPDVRPPFGLYGRPVEELRKSIHDFPDQHSDKYSHEMLGWTPEDYHAAAEEYLNKYEEVQEELKQAHENKIQIITSFPDLLDRELDMNDIDKSLFNSKSFTEAFTCFMEYSAHREHFNDEEEIKEYIDDLNGYNGELYGEEEHSASKIASQLFRTAMDTNGNKHEKVYAACEHMELVLQQGRLS